MDEYSFECYCNEDCSYYHDGHCDFRYAHPKCDVKKYNQRCDLEYYLWTTSTELEGGWT